VFSIIVLGVFAVLTVAALAITGRTIPMDDGSTFHLSRWWTLIPFGLLLVSLFAFTFCTVSPRSEGVVETFGHVDLDNTLDPGPHFTLPWSSVTEIDATSKADVFNNSDAEDDDTTNYHGDIDVRLGDNGVATAKYTLNWAPCEGSAARIFSKYRISDGDKADNPIEKMRNNLVVNESRAAVVDALGTYNPTGPIDELDIDPDDPAATIDQLKTVNLAPNFGELSTQARTKLEEQFADGGGLVCVEELRITALDLPKATQERINDVLAEVNKARQALAQQVTNTALAAANDIISASLSKNPYILVKQCMDQIKDGTLVPPAGFSCWPGETQDVAITTPADPDTK
jgi:hypothetical protein